MRINNEPLLRQLVGSKLKTRILEFLTGNNVPTSEREMARIFNVSHTAVNKAMKNLLDLNVVQATSVGSSLVWTINQRGVSYNILQMYLRLQKDSILDIVIQRLRSKITDLAYFQVKKGSILSENLAREDLEAHLFGSVIDNSSSPESDIDLLIIPKNKEAEKAIKLNKYLFDRMCSEFAAEIGNKLSIHIHTRDEIERKPELHWAKEVLANPKKGILMYP